MISRGPRYRVPLRRRREGRTDYRRRLALLKAREPRAVVRRSLGSTRVQFVDSTAAGDIVVASAVSKDLVRYGWDGPTGNVPAAYMTGFLAGRRAAAAGVKEAVLDIGLHTPTRGGRVFAALRGILDAGVSVPHGEGSLPKEARVRGEHISEDAVARFENVKSRMEAEYEAA